MKKKQPYYRTAALLGSQQHAPRRTQPRGRTARVPWKLVVPLALVLAALLWLWLDNRWYLMGEDLDVVGASSSARAWEIAVASDMLGWHSFRLRPAEAAERVVEQMPSVIEADAACTRLPATCVIEVVEREPVLAWMTDAGHYWIDAEGVHFPAEGERPDLPLVRGALPATDDPGALVLVLEGVSALAALGVERDGLRYHAERGLVWTDAEGRHVAFGTGGEMDARWQIYQALVAHLEAKGVFPWGIDVRFPRAPTYAMERVW